MNNSDPQYKKMVETPVSRLVVTLGIPTIISMLVTNIYNMSDTYFVGKLGNSASGAVGVIFGFMAIIQAVGFMFGQGAGSIISRKLGALRAEEAHIIASTSLACTFIIGLMMSLCSLIFMKPLLGLLGSTSTIYPLAKKYVVFIICTAPFNMCGFVLNNILRFEGKARVAMIGLVSGGIINIALDPLFMFVFNMGVAGAGLATGISQLISFSILFSFFVRGKTSSKLSWTKIHIEAMVIWEIVSTGFPSFVRQGLGSISTILLNNLAGDYGDYAISAMSIVNRIAFFMFAVGLGLGQGYQPVCGYNYGAGRQDRVKQAFKFTLIAEEIIMGSLAIVGLIFSDSIVGVFRDDPDVIKMGSRALKYSCIALYFQPITVMANMTFQSTGQKLKATLTAMLRSGIYFIPILLLFEWNFGKHGIELAQPVSDILSFFTVLPIIGSFVYKLGRNENEKKV